MLQFDKLKFQKAHTSNPPHSLYISLTIHTLSSIYTLSSRYTHTHTTHSSVQIHIYTLKHKPHTHKHILKHTHTLSQAYTHTLEL